MYVLFIFIAVLTPGTASGTVLSSTVTSTPGFTSLQACRRAAEAAQASIGGVNVRAKTECHPLS